MEHIDEFLGVLTIALDTLYYKDQYLINHESMRYTKDSKHISELSISHKLGHYLALLITEYDVDCEYNRNVADKKVWGRVVLDQILLFINVAIMRKILLL